MKELSELGKSMLEWFSDFWIWIGETRLSDISSLFPDSVANLPVSSVILGGVITFYIVWVLVSWAIDILP